MPHQRGRELAEVAGAVVYPDTVRGTPRDIDIGDAGAQRRVQFPAPGTLALPPREVLLERELARLRFALEVIAVCIGGAEVMQQLAQEALRLGAASADTAAAVTSAAPAASQG